MPNHYKFTVATHNYVFRYTWYCFSAMNLICFKWAQACYFFKATHREKVASNKTPALTKSANMVIWVVGATNKSLWSVHFVVTNLFVLTLASDIALLYENDAFSIYFQLQNDTPDFWKRFLFSRKSVSKLKNWKLFLINTNFPTLAVRWMTKAY